MKPASDLRWSIQREWWEHRAIWIAPAAVAGLIVLAFGFNVPRLLDHVSQFLALDPAKQRAVAAMPFGIAGSIVMLTGWLVGVFYCIEALNAERRDRSILFWKSMPVSDATTVLSKVVIALGIIPLVAMLIAFATQAIMLAASSAIVAAKGLDAGLVWRPLPYGVMTLGFVYGVVVHIFWYAPIFGWLLLVSAWAKRSPFLWAFLPWIVLALVERLAFSTGHVASMLRYRVLGGMHEAFAADALQKPITRLSQLEPEKLLASPGLWVGLAFAIVFVVAAIRLRRHREPI